MTVYQNHYGSGDNIYGNNITFYGPVARHLNQVEIDKLKPFLPSNRDIEIQVWHLMGDNEARTYASEIKLYLESNGWKVDPFLGSFMWTETFAGVHVKNLSKENKWRFEVGSAK